MPISLIEPSNTLANTKLLALIKTNSYRTGLPPNVFKKQRKKISTRSAHAQGTHGLA
jgi:hypothetical protein